MDPNNSVIKRLWCIFTFYLAYTNLQISHFSPSDAGILFSFTRGVSPIFSKTVFIIAGLGFLKLKQNHQMNVTSKTSSWQHFDIFFLFFPDNILLTFHEMSKYIFWKKNRKKTWICHLRNLPREWYRIIMFFPKYQKRMTCANSVGVGFLKSDHNHQITIFTINKLHPSC